MRNTTEYRNCEARRQQNKMPQRKIKKRKGEKRKENGTKGDRYKKRGRRKSTWSQRRYRCSKERDHQLKLETKDCQEEEETQGDDERQEKTAE